MRHVGSWAPIGVHATFLRPDLAGKMVRQRRDGSDYPSRKMLGEAQGGAVMLGRPAGTVRLFDGEGLETVLSGMALAGAGDDACGMAALSLDNLQGRPMLIRGALPLHEPRVDPEAPGVAFARAGPVVALIDADMKPLRGPRDPRSGAWRGVPVIERRRGPIVRRTITTAERAALCSALVVQSWRAVGVRATAFRPRMGQDFNDAVREGDIMRRDRKPNIGLATISLRFLQRRRERVDHHAGRTVRTWPLQDAFVKTLHCGPEKRIWFAFVTAGDTGDEARHIRHWHEDLGDVVWWKFPVVESPFVGSPLGSDWPGYHTHFTPLPALPHHPRRGSRWA